MELSPRMKLHGHFTGFDGPDRDWMDEQLDLIEEQAVAEARAALLAELRAKVEGLPRNSTTTTIAGHEPYTTYGDNISRTAVLALLAEPLGNSKR